MFGRLSENLANAVWFSTLILEFARNALGFTDAEHGEYDRTPLGFL
jgi:hypothetical protein